jgi:AraC-like DNA-binding protein
MSTTPHPAPLREFIAHKLVEWSQNEARERLVTAHVKSNEVRLPEMVKMSPAGKLGRPVSTRGRRVYNNHIITTRWPRHGQETLRIPMLWLVVAGQLNIRLGEYYLQLDPNSAVLIPPGVPHPSGQFYSRPNVYCDVLILSPRNRQMQCWLTRHRNGDVRQIDNICVLDTSLADTLDRIVEELTERRLNSDAISHHLLTTLCLTLQREVELARYVEILPTATLPSLEPADYDPVDKAKQYIQAHLNQELTLQKVAQVVHLSRSQFIVQFRAQTGQTFVEYVTQLRLEWACQLLRETGWTIHHICTFTGFKAPSYFHRLFHRKVGMTPIQYRKTALQSDLDSKRNFTL